MKRVKVRNNRLRIHGIRKSESSGEMGFKEKWIKLESLLRRVERLEKREILIVNSVKKVRKN